MRSARQPPQLTKVAEMTGRNDQCPCGSGKKYKRCCLSNDKEVTHAKVQAEQLELESSVEARAEPRIPEPFVGVKP